MLKKIIQIIGTDISGIYFNVGQIRKGNVLQDGMNQLL
jgi:hypothetical protein